MPSLSDHIDRLAVNTKNISVIAHSAFISSSRPGPFTSAILHAHLGDLIRDVDPSELGLFSLVHPERAAVQDKPVEIERISFHGVTPLRRPHPFRGDASRARARGHDPELYAEAAMKYIDRYTIVRPMPRAQAQVHAVLERIPVIKQSIDDLKDRLHQFEQTRSSTEPDYKAQLEEEERRIGDLRSRLSQLTNKRFALSKAKKSHLDLAENKGVMRTPIASSMPNPEDEFWNTPAASARTFKFTGDNLLMDEKADFGDISTISFSASPMISKTTSNIFTSTGLDLPFEIPNRRLLQASGNTLPDVHIPPERPYHNLSGSPPLPTQDTGDHDTPEPVVDVDVPTRAHEESFNDNVFGIVVTHKVESITDKIWAVMVDLVTAAAATKGINLCDQPSARDLICYLQYMQEATPSHDLAPATGGAPTLQQVLIATLVTNLLASTADHSLPLTGVKELLANRTKSSANPSQLNSSRIIYHCVAKRLLKIDRSGSEQTVRFDV